MVSKLLIILPYDLSTPTPTIQPLQAFPDQTDPFIKPLSMGTQHLCPQDLKKAFDHSGSIIVRAVVTHWLTHGRLVKCFCRSCLLFLLTSCHMVESLLTIFHESSQRTKEEKLEAVLAILAVWNTCNMLLLKLSESKQDVVSHDSNKNYIL